MTIGIRSRTRVGVQLLECRLGGRILDGGRAHQARTVQRFGERIAAQDAEGEGSGEGIAGSDGVHRSGRGRAGRVVRRWGPLPRWKVVGSVGRVGW